MWPHGWDFTIHKIAVEFFQATQTFVCSDNTAICADSACNLGESILAARLMVMISSTVRRVEYLSRDHSKAAGVYMLQRTPAWPSVYLNGSTRDHNAKIGAILFLHSPTPVAYCRHGCICAAERAAGRAAAGSPADDGGRAGNRFF